MFYNSYKFLQGEIQKQKSRENYSDSGSGGEGVSIGMLIIFGLLFIIELVLTIFAFIFSFKCHAAGRIPTWALVLFCIFLILPTPFQPMLALAIYGGVSHC